MIDEHNFVEAMRADGLDVNKLGDQGRFHNVKRIDRPNKNKSGWYYYIIENDILFGTYGCFYKDFRCKYTTNKYKQLSPDERKCLDDNANYRKMKFDQAIAEQATKAASKAQNFFANTQTPGEDVTTPYLGKKNIPAFGEVRVYNGDLFVPISVDGQISSFQQIKPNSDKKFLPFGTTKGGSFHIRGWSDRYILCEGYATGVSLSIATNAYIIVCFSANNLKIIAEQIRKQCDTPIVIAADNDAKKHENVGLNKALEVKKSVKNVDVIYPQNINGTDFNDFANEKGYDVLKEYIRYKLDKNRQRLIPFAELKESAPNWIFKGFLPFEKVGVIYGQSGHFKSFFVIDLACHLVSGMDYQGLFKCREQRPVVYVCGEGKNGIKRRVDGWLKHHNIDPNIPFYITQKTAQLLNDSDTNELIDLSNEIAKTALPPVIIIDTLNRCFGDGDENSTRDMTAFVEQIDRLADSTNAMVLIVHHSGKGDAKAARGSSVLRGAIDVEYSVSLANADARNDDPLLPAEVEITNTKMKDHDSPSKLTLFGQRVDLFTDEDGDQISTQVLVQEVKTLLNDVARNLFLGQIDQQSDNLNKHKIAFANAIRMAVNNIISRTNLINTSTPIKMQDVDHYYTGCCAALENDKSTKSNAKRQVLVALQKADAIHDVTAASIKLTQTTLDLICN